MSDAFDDREQGFEAKYKLDQETRFKAKAKRNRMLALWAGEQLGLDQDAVEILAARVIEADLKEVGDQNVKRFLLDEFQSRGVALTEETLDEKFEQFFDLAMIELRR